MLDHLSCYLTDTPGCLILYLPPYSPDLTPIEESFSACMSWLFEVIYMCAIHLLFIVKAYIRRHANELHQHNDPALSLLEAMSCITADKARGRFKNAGYIVA
jgi:hypothetical protein